MTDLRRNVKFYSPVQFFCSIWKVTRRVVELSQYPVYRFMTHLCLGLLAFLFSTSHFVTTTMQTIHDILVGAFKRCPTAQRCTGIPLLSRGNQFSQERSTIKPVFIDSGFQFHVGRFNASWMLLRGRNRGRRSRLFRISMLVCCSCWNVERPPGRKYP
jgi:hypothetical protein